MSSKRLQKDIIELQNNPVNGITIISNDDLYKWRCLLKCSDGPYENLDYEFIIIFPTDYPFKGPNILFKTTMFHPNVNPYGILELSSFEHDWCPALTINKIFIIIIMLMKIPEEPIKGKTDKIMANPYAYELFKNDYDSFKKEIHKWYDEK